MIETFFLKNWTLERKTFVWLNIHDFCYKLLETFLVFALEMFGEQISRKQKRFPSGGQKIFNWRLSSKILCGCRNICIVVREKFAFRASRSSLLCSFCPGPSHPELPLGRGGWAGMFADTSEGSAVCSSWFHKTDVGHMSRVWFHAAGVCVVDQLN